MDSPGYDSPPDGDDVIYPCKGCGEILEEGKAFELAGNRWHIHCFKCNTCGDPLDSDANLLLLGDGSLICNKCTYSCNACNNKIEDLAILTGDQAFCANCFRCRNCKRKIENLRYARTSQGIFCMSCHESLMARRRKKSKQRQQTAGATNGTTPIVLDKSLPALPPQAVPLNSFTPDLDTPGTEATFNEMPVEPSPRPRQSKSRKEYSPGDLEQSPPSNDEKGLTLPASTYNPNRKSRVDIGEDEAFIPLAFDPNPAPGPSPLLKNKKFAEEPTPKSGDSRNPRDYFNTRSSTQAAHRDLMRDNRGGASRSSSSEREKPTKPLQSSPHIAYQEKGRHPSDNLVENLRKRKEVPAPSPSNAQGNTRPQQTSSPSIGRTDSNNSNNFKLQDVPPNRKAGSRRGSKSDVKSPSQNGMPTDLGIHLASPGADSARSGPPSANEYSLDAKKFDDGASSLSAKLERPARGDSLNASSLKPSVSRNPSDSRSSPSTPTMPAHERKGSTSSALPGRDGQTNGGWSLSSPVDSPSKDLAVPPRAPGRSSMISPSQASQNESYTAPRAAPPPPPVQHRPSDSISSIQSDSLQQQAAGLLRYSGGPDFSLDADMARILGGAEGETHDREPSVLRKVSNAVSRHGRSFSDRGGSRGSNNFKVRSPHSGSIDISSPTTASPESKDEVVELRNRLRRAQQRITELEAEKLTWQEQNATADIKQANTELREKRSTISILDTQREMLIRELEIMTDEVAKAKENQKPVDPSAMKTSIYERFSSSLEKLKDSIGDQIEELVQKRQELTNEITTLIQMKDKGFQEYESLTSKNHQLIEMNNQLVANIQDFYKANRHPQSKASFEAMRTANGLGIYTHHKEKSDMSVDVRSTDTPLSAPYSLDNSDAHIIHEAPAIVEVKKAKPMKFSTWKKGGTSAAKGFAKGFKGAFASEKPPSRDDVFISHPYGSVQGGAEPITISAPQVNVNAATTPKSATDKPGFGFFGQKEKGGKMSQLKHSQSNSSSTNLAAAEPPNVLFGSDLTARCDYEKRTIPSIVIKCIQEVQIRGMDLEGIYRKSGGTGQINQIKSGFEANDDYDISDPDLDITAVTSVLKQWFRRLPVPLVTFDVYDRFLAAGAIAEKERRCNEIRACLNELPRAHLECVQFLIFHLAQIVEHPTTKMTPLNLAVVFAPTMMRPTSIEREMSDMSAQKNAVQALIEDADKIFSGDL